MPYIEGLKYDTLGMFHELLQPGNYMVALDQKSCYFHFRLRPDLWRFLGLEWKDQLYVATVLPFGLSLACSAVTDLMGAVWWLLRSHGIPLIYMIDDVGFTARTFDASLSQLRTAALLLSALGFIPSFEKCQLIPSQQLKLLGFLLAAHAPCAPTYPLTRQITSAT